MWSGIGPICPVGCEIHGWRSTGNHGADELARREGTSGLVEKASRNDGSDSISSSESE